MSQETAARWGLPADFAPVRYPIDGEVKEVLRPLLSAGEPVLVTLSNIEGTVSVVATPQHLFAIRSGDAIAGVTGFAVREFPWAGITKLVLQQAGTHLKFAIGFRSSNGRTVEVGRRAALGKDAVENLMPFESASGHETFAAIYQLWEFFKNAPDEEI